MQLPGLELTLYEKRIVGSLFGSGAPHLDIPRMIELRSRDRRNWSR
ncbi:MAG: hypothetical protein ACOYD4_01935 [Solirubrobacterales bacterium]